MPAAAAVLRNPRRSFFARLVVELPAEAAELPAGGMTTTAARAAGDGIPPAGSSAASAGSSTTRRAKLHKAKTYAAGGGIVHEGTNAQRSKGETPMLENRTALLGAIVCVVALTIFGVIKEHDSSAQIILFGGQTVILLAGYLKVTKLGHEMNGMKDALVTAARNEGKLQEKVDAAHDLNRPPAEPDIFRREYIPGPLPPQKG